MADFLTGLMVFASFALVGVFVVAAIFYQGPPK